MHPSRPRAESSSSESKWIGSILAEDDPEESFEEEKQPEIRIDRKEPVARSTSAPPQLSSQSASDVPIDENDPRLSPQYFAYYYSQRPLDPRLPQPLFNWSSWRYMPRGIDERLDVDPISSGRSEAEPRTFPTPTDDRSGSKKASDDPLELPRHFAGLSLNLESASSSSSSSSSSSRSARSVRSDRLPSGDGRGDVAKPKDAFTRAPMNGPSVGLSSTSAASQSATIPAYFRGSSSFVGLSSSSSSSAALGAVRPIASPMMAILGYGAPAVSAPAPYRPLAESTLPESSAGATSSLHEYRSSYSHSLSKPAPSRSVSNGGGGGGAAPAPSATVPPYWDKHPTYIREREPEPEPEPEPEAAEPDPEPEPDEPGAVDRLEPLELPREKDSRPRTKQASHESRSGARSKGPRASPKRSSRSDRSSGSPTSAPHPAPAPAPVAAAAAAAAASSPLPRSRSGGVDPARPSWLEEFRHKNISHLTLRSVVSRGLLIELAVDQNGSRFIQTKLETASLEEKQAAFEQLLPEGLVLCTDVFGNYVIQKFFEFGTFEQKKLLAGKLVGNVKSLSLQMYGCRVIQKALEVLDVDTQANLVRELEGHVMECVKDQNGNHVIQKCIEKVPPYLINFIVEAFMNQVYSLSIHPYGCRVIQRLLENCSESQRNSILSEVLDTVEDLCKNQYGNYVIQHVLVNGTAWHKQAIIRSLRGKVFPLSKHKFASNVVEKCFAHGSDDDRHILIDEIIGKGRDDSSGKSPLILMVKDQYANYVVQKILDVARDEQRSIIIARIKRHIPNLRKLPYGKHIIARIEKMSLVREGASAPSRAPAAAAASRSGGPSMHGPS